MTRLHMMNAPHAKLPLPLQILIEIVKYWMFACAVRHVGVDEGDGAVTAITSQVKDTEVFLPLTAGQRLRCRM
ncbi:hypothetical protein [Paracoccus yeei]|uniref:hypothetical protein n=1 Tax=Paracoccus yeei TaxID=147645 RepID=UPI0012DE9B7D